MCSLVWIVWVESRQLCHSANLDSKSVEDCLWFLSSDRVRKSTSCGLIFSGRPLPSLFLTSPVYKTWPSSWSWYYGFLQIQLEVVLWHRCQTVLSAAQNKSQQKNKLFFSLAEKILEVLMGATQIFNCCPTNKCIFTTNVAPCKGK